MRVKLEQWEKNLYAVWVGQFLALMGANLVFPFIPFFIGDLGIEDKSSQALWTGVSSGATGAMLFISSPIWGSRADRFGAASAAAAVSFISALSPGSGSGLSWRAP